MIITKHFHRKRRDGDWKPDVSMYNTQATSFLKLQQEGKQKIAYKEKSTLESLLPLVAASLTPFALQAQTSCPNNPGVVNSCDANPQSIEQSIDIDGDGQVDMMVHGALTDANSGSIIGSIVSFENTSTWLTAGYVGYAPYTYFNAYASGATINESNVNLSSQAVARLGCPSTNFESWLDYNPKDPVAYPNPNGAWDGQTGASPGLYMAFKKDGVLGFVEFIYTDGPSTVTIGNYGIACDASITSIIAGDCSSLVVSGPPIAITTVISEDTNNDGTIDFSESSGAVDVEVNLSVPATGGEILVIDDGINPPNTFTLSAGTATLTTTVPLPPNGTTLTVTATITSGCSSGTASDQAIINITPPPANDDCATPTVLSLTQDCLSPLLATTVGATVSPETPGFSCSNGGPATGKDVWFELTVPPSGNVAVNTSQAAGGLTDMVLEAFIGTCGAPLTSIACNDDIETNINNHSEIVMTSLTPGTTLLIRAMAWDGNAEGEFNICASPPTFIANDLCDGAIDLPVGSGSCAGDILASNTLISSDSGETPAPSCGNYNGGDQWFKLTVPASGEVTIETNQNGSNAFQDSAISAYSGNCNVGLTEIACDDDGNPNGNGLFSLLELTGQTPGSTLYIRAWEHGNSPDAKGDFLICAWDTNPNPCPDYSAATGTPLTGPQNADADFESDNQIDSDQLIDAPATMVDYDSAVSIQLQQGFEVKGGVVFHAFIDGCVGNGL